MLTVEIYYNRLISYADDGTRTNHGGMVFSNGRMIVSDFNGFTTALENVLQQAVLLEKFHLPGGAGRWMAYQMKTKLLRRDISDVLRLVVCEDLVGGISQIEAKVLHEAAAALGVKKVELLYHDQPADAFRESANPLHIGSTVWFSAEAQQRAQAEGDLLLEKSPPPQVQKKRGWFGRKTQEEADE